MKIETLKQLIELMKKRKAFYDSLPSSVQGAFMDNPAVSALEVAVDLLVRELCTTEDQADYCEWLMYDFNGVGESLYIGSVEHKLKTTDEAIILLEGSGLWGASK